MQKINPFIWFNDQAQEAAKLYTSLFENTTITSSSPMMTTFTLAGRDFLALNGGPMFRPTSSISFFVQCETLEQVDRLWNGLSDGGNIMMPLNTYPFSEKYGWTEDKFGVSWQISLTKKPQSIAPALLFAGAHQGQAEEAVNFYLSEFPDTKLNLIVRYEESDRGPTGQLKFSSFSLFGEDFIAMDSGMPMDVNFTEGVSLFLNCETQEEVDKYWEELSAGGEKSQCGWLKDKFGVSWQVIPTALGRLAGSGNPQQSQNVFKAMMGMKKIDISQLEEAYETA